MESWIYNKKPDIVCLTETHITHLVPDNEIDIVNYKHYRTDTDNKRTGGIITYIKKDINCKVVFNENRSKDGIWIHMLEIGNEKITICNLYRSPNSSKSKFCNNLIRFIDNLQDINKLIITGDFNIDVSRDNYYSRKLVNELMYIGLIQKVHHFTRSTFKSNTIIDLVFSNFNVRTTVLDIPKITDHNIIEIRLIRQNINHDRQEKFYTRDFRNFDKVVFQSILNKKLIKLDFKESCDDKCDINYYNLIVNKTIGEVENCLNEVAPIIERMSKIKWNLKPWMNKMILSKMRDRDKAFKRAKNSKEPKDINSYKKLRNDIVCEIRKSKREHYEMYIDKNKSQPDKLWKGLKELIGDKKKCDSSAINKIEFNDEIIIDPNVIVNKLNKYFVHNVKLIVNDIKSKRHNINNIENVNSVSNIVKWKNFDEITVSQVNKIIESLDCKKGAKTEINASIINIIWETEKKAIMFMLKNSLTLGVVPEKWKISTVIPIQKVKGNDKVENLRPINTLPIIEQILEQLVKIQLENFLAVNNILNEEQSGFRKSHSCETALQNCFIDWRNALDNGQLVGLLCIDLAKAFETINRTELINTLESLGISHIVKDWFTSYLGKRQQRVKFKNVTSNNIYIEEGVPQGSKLGPLLFIIYINDIVKIFKNVGIVIRLFADDMILYVTNRYVKRIESKLNEALKLLNDWLVGKQLKINIEKTKFMILHDQRTKNVRGQCNLLVNNQKIAEVKTTKYLGVIIDDNLTFKENAIQTIKKVASKINVISRLGNSVTPYTKCTIYKSITAPHYDYCSTVMINYTQNHIDILQKLQNRAMRIILGVNKYTRIDLMLDTLGWMSIRQRLKYNTLVLVHKMINKLTPMYLQKHIKRNGEMNNYYTRNGSMLKINYTRTHTAEKTITYKGFQWYNELPYAIRSEKTLERFKSSVKVYIKSCD